MTDHISVADTAKIIRDKLKKSFPGVVFSVRSKSYSMGASITVEWTDGPTKSAVEAITNQFEGSSFDGMQDLKTYHDSVWEGRKVHWGADSVHTTRNYSKGFYSQIVNKVCEKYLVPVPEIKQNSYTYKGKTSFSNPYIEDDNTRICGRDTLTDLIYQEISKTPANIDATQSLASGSINGISVAVTENPAKGGIEIRFSDKPPADVIEALGKNGAGFKFSRAQGIWYAKRTDQKMAFAQSLVERFNQPVQPTEIDDNSDVFLAAMQAIAEVNEILATLEVDYAS